MRTLSYKEIEIKTRIQLNMLYNFTTNILHWQRINVTEVCQLEPSTLAEDILTVIICLDTERKKTGKARRRQDQS